MRGFSSYLRCCLGLVLLAPFANAAAEGCSRPITVGLTPAGNAVTVSADGKVGGLYVEILEQLSRQSRCTFRFEALPRARAVHMFQSGGVDLIAPASQSAERDQLGDFVPASTIAVSLLTMKSSHPDPLRALQQGRLMVNTVRSFDFGPAYRQLLNRLQEQERLEEVVDTDTVARKMAAGRADATIMPALVFYPSAVTGNIVQQVVATPLPDLPAITSGLYLSRSSLPEADRAWLTQQMQKLVESGEFRRLIQARYAADWALTGYQAMGAAGKKK